MNSGSVNTALIDNDIDGTRSDIGYHSHINYYTGENGWYIDPLGSDVAGLGNGEQSSPYKSIKSAFNFIDQGSSGDIVNLLPGTYN